MSAARDIFAPVLNASIVHVGSSPTLSDRDATAAAARDLVRECIDEIRTAARRGCNVVVVATPTAGSKLADAMLFALEDAGTPRVTVGSTIVAGGPYFDANAVIARAARETTTLCPPPGYAGVFVLTHDRVVLCYVPAE